MAESFSVCWMRSCRPSCGLGATLLRQVANIGCEHRVAALAPTRRTEISAGKVVAVRPTAFDDDFLPEPVEDVGVE